MRDDVARWAWLVCVIACRWEFDPVPPSPIGAPGGSFAYSILRIDRVSIDEPLIDFPVPITLDADHLDRSVMRSDGADLRFYLEGQTPALLAHEIEDVGNASGAPLIA